MTSVLVPLLGVVIGAGGALLGQYLSTRITTRQAMAARVAAIRQERKEAIMAFLEVVQDVEQAAEYRYENGSLPEDARARTHKMWFRQKCIELIGPAELNKKALDYSWRLNNACYRELPKGANVWGYMSQRRDPFLATARDELGIAQPENGSGSSPGA